MFNIHIQNVYKRNARQCKSCLRIATSASSLLGDPHKVHCAGRGKQSHKQGGLREERTGAHRQSEAARKAVRMKRVPRNEKGEVHLPCPQCCMRRQSLATTQQTNPWLTDSPCANPPGPESLFQGLERNRFREAHAHQGVCLILHLVEADQLVGRQNRAECIQIALLDLQGLPFHVEGLAYQ